MRTRKNNYKYDLAVCFRAPVFVELKGFVDFWHWLNILLSEIDSRCNLVQRKLPCLTLAGIY